MKIHNKLKKSFWRSVKCYFGFHIATVEEGRYYCEYCSFNIPMHETSPFREVEKNHDDYSI